MKEFLNKYLFVNEDRFPWDTGTRIPLLIKHGYLFVWALFAIFIVYAAFVTLYWTHQKSVDTVSYDFGKKGKPTGVLLMQSENWKPVDIQTAAQHHWTVVVFTVLGTDASMLGYQIGDGYVQDEIHKTAVGTGEILGKLHEKLPKDVVLWIVRLDPTSAQIADPGIAELCNHCTDGLFTAAYNRGGKYGNFYDETKKWYMAQFASKATGEDALGVHVPAYAILDPDGDLRVMHAFFSGGNVYADMMHLTGGKMDFTAEDIEPRLFEHKQPWYADYLEFMSGLAWFVVIVVMIGVIGMGIATPSNRN